MKKIFIIVLCLTSSLTIAVNKNVFEENNLKYITKDCSPLIRDYASGVAALSSSKNIKGGCTAFRVSRDKMLTNFHCLPLIHQHFNLAANKGIYLGPMSDYLYNFLAHNYKKEPVRSQIIDTLGFLPEYLPKNNEEAAKYMTNHPNELGYISFSKTIDFEGDLSDTSFKISKVDAVNEDLDYAFITVKGLPAKQMILKLSAKKIKDDMPLAMIGHPADKNFTGVKMYEASSNCKVIDSKLGVIFNRTHNFGHHCDTEGGSSGSPVMDRKTGEVIGLHWAGLGKENMNKAIIVKKILEEIKEVYPELYQQVQ